MNHQTSPSRQSHVRSPDTSIGTLTGSTYVLSSSSGVRTIPLGVSTALAAIAHEIPQEAGDFAILLAAGYSRTRALVLNFSSAIGGVAGAAAMLLFGSRVPDAVPYVLAFAAGNFLYVAMADLIPTLHHGTMDKGAVRQLILIGAGIATIILL